MLATCTQLKFITNSLALQKIIRCINVNKEFSGIIQVHKDMNMIKILGTEYITRKEASSRYGLSIAWFEQRQHNHEEPHFIKIRGKGKAYYPLEKTDLWFRNNLKESE